MEFTYSLVFLTQKMRLLYWEREHKSAFISGLNAMEHYIIIIAV